MAPPGLDVIALRRAPEEMAHCPVDGWDYPPRYTDGVCPLCGRKPEGIEVRAPWAAHIDWFWPAIAGMTFTSLVMGALVVTAWLRGG